MEGSLSPHLYMSLYPRKNITNLRMDTLRISDQMKVFVQMLGNYRRTTKYNKEVEVESKSITSERAWRLLSKAGAGSAECRGIKRSTK